MSSFALLVAVTFTSVAAVIVMATAAVAAAVAAAAVVVEVAAGGVVAAPLVALPDRRLRSCRGLRCVDSISDLACLPHTFVAESPRIDPELPTS
jgi:hypothetical protein